MAHVDDLDMEIDSEEYLEEELDEEIEDGSVQSESYMEVEQTARRPRFVPYDRPVDTSYGKPRLDALPTAVMVKIANMIGLADVMALRRTNSALKRFTLDALDIWKKKVKYYRQTPLLIGAEPVHLPQHASPPLQEELLRCAFILRRHWMNPGFQLGHVPHKISDYTPEGVEQILFVPDTLGRYFLVVSHKQVYLWTLEPNSHPQMCRRIFPWAGELDEQERITNVMVTRPRRCKITYLAIQFSPKNSSRLRTEIFQLHLSKPMHDPRNPSFGLVGIHMTEGALVAFTDFVLAYALGDPAQTILLCCWVTRQATRLTAPVRDWEVRWQHQSCRAVTIGADIIIVVRDSAAEVYPRDIFTILDDDQQPPIISLDVIQGDFEYLPPTYATDIAVFPVSFVKNPKIHIHEVRTATSTSGIQNIDICVRPISLIGVARSPVPLTDPSVPYYAATAQLFRTPTPRPTPNSSSVSTPNFSNPPSPSHTAPPSPSHTARRVPPPPPLPEPERYKFVFHVHALQPQHPHLAYGPILAGPNGRGVMMATNLGIGGGPRQYIVKFRHPTDFDLLRMVQPDGNSASRPVPRMLRMPQTNAHLPPQPHQHLSTQPLLPQMPPQMTPHIHPPPPHQTGPTTHAPPTPPDPFSPLLPLMRINSTLDVMRTMTALWTTTSPVGYELVAWDEGGGSLLIGSRRGDLAVLECAFPLRTQPQPQARLHPARA